MFSKPTKGQDKCKCDLLLTHAVPGVGVRRLARAGRLKIEGVDDVPTV